MKDIPERALRSGNAETGDNYRVVVAPTKLTLCRNFRNLFGGVFLLALAFILPSVVEAYVARWGISVPKEVRIALGGIFAFGGIVTLIVDVFVRRMARRYVFDTRNKMLRVLKQGVVESEHDLSGAIAFQLACARCETHASKGAGHHATRIWWSCELNLVLHSEQGPQRQNLICAAGRKSIRKLGEKLADRLGVPLVDHATSEDRKREKEGNRTRQM